MSRPGCEKIIRYAFEYAKQYGRKKVSCFSKENIMKQMETLKQKIYMILMGKQHIRWVKDNKCVKN